MTSFVVPELEILVFLEMKEDHMHTKGVEQTSTGFCSKNLDSFLARVDGTSLLAKPLYSNSFCLSNMNEWSFAFWFNPSPPPP